MGSRLSGRHGKAWDKSAQSSLSSLLGTLWSRGPTSDSTKSQLISQQWMKKTCTVQNGIIGITRNDKARDKFCVTYLERSRILQDTRCLFSLEDDEEEITFVRSDSLPSRSKRDTDDVKKLVIHSGSNCGNGEHPEARAVANHIVTGQAWRC